MKKIKYTNIFIFLSIFIIILLTIISKPLSDLDELWNYNIANNISKGLIPYRDISMITTPLLGIITAIFLKFTANELIVTRILGAILGTVILYSLHRTMKILKFNDNVNYLVILILLMNLRNHFCLDYNWAVILVGIIILNLDLKNIQIKEENIENNNLKYEIFIGILVGIAICIKQSIGVLIAVASIIYNIIFLKGKKDIKIIGKNILFRIIGIALTILILLVLYLQYNTNSLYAFIDYCILGIKTFSNSVPYKDLLSDKSIFVKVTAILIPLTYIITCIIILYNLLKRKEYKKHFTLLIYGISTFAMIFPISNDSHFLIGSLISMILLSYLIYSMKKFIPVKFNKIIKFIIIFCCSFILLYTLVNTIKNYINETKKYEIRNDISHYKFIPINDLLYNVIKNMDTFILSCNKDVYILDSDAVVYMIPIDRYHKDYDMFNKGNFGLRGEEGKIEDLKNEKDIIVLIKKDDVKKNWQTPETVTDFVKNNFIKIGDINIFDIYVKEEIIK